MRAIEAVACKAHGFAEAEQHEVKPQLEMRPDERRAVAKALRDRYYGTNVPDVREAHHSR